MRIEQYFLMIDYSLWEVILNRDSPAPTRFVDSVLQPVAPTTAEQKLARKNELKARGSNSESLDQIHDRLQKLTHTLIWRNKTDLEEQSLDDLFNSLKIYEAEVKSSSSAGTTTQNIAFVSSSNTDNTTEPISAAASVSTVCAKMHVSSLPNIDANDLEEMDLKWKMAMLTMRARRFLQRTRRNFGANGPTSLGFDMSKVECYNFHMKGHFARECRSPKDSRKNDAAEPQRRNVPSFQADEEPTNYALMAFSSSSSSFDNEVVSCSKACSKAYAQLQSHYDKLTADFCKSQFDVISYHTGLESVEARLLVYKQNESIFEKDIKLLNLEVQLRDNALVTLRQKLEKAEHERDDLKLKFQPSDGYHVVPPPYTGTFMPPKADLVFNTAPAVVETDHSAFNVKLSPTKPDQDLSHTNRPTTPIIEDWVSDSEDKSETKPPQNRVLVTKPHNKTPYELLYGRTPSIGFMRPFGCPVTILNTLDFLGKFDGKVDEGFLVGYSVRSCGPTWLFDIDSLTKTMNYQPVTAGNQSNPSAGFQDKFDVEKAGEEESLNVTFDKTHPPSKTSPMVDDYLDEEEAVTPPNWVTAEYDVPE
nr:retrovirus-related Pol polyprotein from transposon TNT 1-94 [Tanacetum cinerariifolium]